MQRLIDGYHRFREEGYGELADRLRALAEEQHPHNLFITCSDSRVLPDLIVSALPGELFVIRNAGNIVTPFDECLNGDGGTLEYAVSVLEVRHIIVCGHSNCGAIKALMHPEELDDLPLVRAWLAHAGLEIHRLRPEVARSLIGLSEDELRAEESARINQLVEQNVVRQLDHLLTHPHISRRVARGDLHIHGWVFDIADGRIRAHDRGTGAFLEL
jgi:carbonic anhydrase